MRCRAVPSDISHPGRLKVHPEDYKLRAHEDHCTGAEASDLCGVITRPPVPVLSYAHNGFLHYTRDVPSLSPERNTSTEVQPAEGSKPPAASPTAMGSVPLTPTWW